MKRAWLFSIVVLVAVPACQQTNIGARKSSKSATIICSSKASLAERLAAKEIRRYVYLRTGILMPIIQHHRGVDSANPCIVIGRKDRGVIATMLAMSDALEESVVSLQPQQYRLKTLRKTKQPTVLITGGDELGTLYGAYRFVEHLGVRFYLHGDTVPDETIALELPELDETGKPLFELRGIHPFHDFPEGPDWWDTDKYKAVLAQLPKLRMNFFGLHCYPEGGVGPEPTVWIGRPQDIGPDGKVKFSYPARHFTTYNGTWGYEAADTEDFHFGAAVLFARDAYGVDYMRQMALWPETLQECNEMFNRFGNVLNDAFTFARKLGVKTCIGTETPLTIPKLTRQRLMETGKDPNNAAVVQELYEGMFQRIMGTHPLDYYWLWTPEYWTWQDVKDERVAATQDDLLLAMAAAEKIHAPFTLATCGWVLGPPKDRAQFDNVLPKTMPFSCINRQVGKAPVEPQFAKVKGRPKWAIPWLEDDPGMISPQLWAGRMRKDGADALAYGCTGLMGIHWRTRILGPNVSALAKAAWDERLPAKFDAESAKAKKAEGVVGGKVAHFPDHAIADTQDDPLYRNVRYDVSAYRLEVPNGSYTVTLQFCEPHYGQAGKRVFGVKVQGKQVIENLDIFAAVEKDRALDYQFENIEVGDGILEISFDKVVEFPCIAAIAVEGETTGTNQQDSRHFAKKINCGGGTYKDYRADLEATPDESRFLPADDFYADWALHQFGPEAAEPIAEIFSRIDCHLHEPSTWIQGPGGIVTNNKPWSQVAKSYKFVDELAALGAKIQGAANRARFHYWLNSFRFMKAMARVGCTLGALDGAIEQMKNEKDASRRKMFASEKALPLRRQLTQSWADMVGYLLATVSNSGEMGTVANIEQHSMRKLQLLNKHDKAIEEALGESLPADTKPGHEYRGPTRVIVPTVRTSLMAEEDLKLKVIILSQNEPRSGCLCWRPMGAGNYNKIPLVHISRSTYSVAIPAERIEAKDLEYHVKVTADDGREITFPATAPQMDQTVVIIQ